MSAEITKMLITIGVLSAFMFFIFNRLSSEIKAVSDEVKIIDRRLIRIEDRIEFSGKTIYIQHEKEKEFKKN